MKRPLLYILSFVILASLMLAIALYIPNTIPAGNDFSGMYYAELALVHGVDIYDLPAIEQLARAASPEIPTDKFNFPPFLYPPWYILSGFYLGLLPAQAAATLWFEINLILLFLSIWFLTDGWDGRMRLVSFLLGIIFLPVIGAMVVGQFVFPLFLGASILMYSLRRENVALTTLGAVLLTFKPHLGALILLSVLAWLVVSRSNPGRRATRSIVVTGIILVLISLPADPKWLVRYPSLLLGLSSNYGQSESVELCSACANLPVYLSRWFFDGSLSKAALIALALFIVLCILFYRVRFALLKQPELFLNAALIITMLVSPYLFNYDFILLLVPFAVLARESNRIEKIIIGACYLAPTILIAIYEREGNVSLIISSLIIAALLFLRAKNQVDANRLASYNTNT